jgi:hypothetical protein
MNYIVEGNINFYDMLNNMDSDNENDNDTYEENYDKYCLITGEKLDKNHITLSCNHSFNFLPLYNEIKMQKFNSSRVHYEYYGLKLHQIKCPYCRTIHNKLLPNVILNDNIKLLRGINSPPIYCMEFHGCSYKYKYGKNKGNTCKNNGFFKGDNCFCLKHHIHHEKMITKIKNKKDTRKQKNECNIDKCKAILKSGKRKGELCNNYCVGDFCKRHSK